MNPAGQIIFGLAVTGASLSYWLPSIMSVDRRLFLAINRVFQQSPWIRIFRVLWPVGRSEFLMVVVLGLVIYNFTLGISAGMAFLTWGLIDRIIKRGVNRTRPFNQLAGIHMLQPKKPKDPSFPSGDTFHIWFLFSIIIQTMAVPLPLVIFLVSIAIMVSLGRIAMGVHYPTDVLAGAGIGLAAAGLCLLINSYIIIIFFYNG